MKIHIFSQGTKTPWVDIILVYLVHQIIVFATDYFGQKFLAGRKIYLEPLVTIIEGLSHWDGRWFIRVATEGYTEKSAAFFPLYPSLIKLLQNLSIDPQIGALLISNIAFFLVLVVFYRLLSRDYDHEIAVRSLWYLGLFPTAFYFSALYTESLYLLFVLLTLYLGRSRRWFLAALCGLLAGLTRNLGLFLVVPLLYEYWKQENLSLKNLSFEKIRSAFWFALIPAGLVGFMYYFWFVLGNPLAFAAAQKFWKRGLDFPWASIYGAIINITKSNNLMNLVFTLLALGILVLAVKRIRPSYTLYMFFGFVIPLSSPAVHSPLMSMPRFILVLFPIYLVLALVIRREQIHWTWVTLSSMSMIFLTMMFTNSRWVA